MTENELLEANGGRWTVYCYRDGNRRRLLRTIQVRADTRMLAERIARRVSHCKCVSASAWNPLADPTLWNYIRQSP